MSVTKKASPNKQMLPHASDTLLAQAWTRCQRLGASLFHYVDEFPQPLLRAIAVVRIIYYEGTFGICSALIVTKYQ